jgi:hypothetical protein
MALAQDHLEPFAVCYQKAVDRLHRVSSPVCSGGLVFITFAASCRTRVLGNICVLQSTFPLASGEAVEAFAILSPFR